MKVLLIDIDSKIPNLALMKISAWHKQQGDYVTMRNCKAYKVYASTVFTRSKNICKWILNKYENVEIGGTGWDIKKTLPSKIESMKPDYDLYGIDYGIGFTSRGCVRKCDFCFVPEKEGKLRQDSKIEDIINHKSNIIKLLDNNFTSDPLMIDKCHEIKERNLIVDITQGIDIRLINDDKAKAIGSIKHLKQIRFAWDLEAYEKQVLEGIRITTQYIRPYRLMCYILCGFNTSFDYDIYRFETLWNLGIDSYVMVYNENPDRRLHHFERWVNGRIYKSCTFEEYKPWINERSKVLKGQLSLV